jgi:hypothetical protein
MFKLKKIVSSHNNLKCKEYVGTCTSLPKKRECFIFFYDNNSGIVRTTPVQTLATKEGTLFFSTENSIYELSSIEGEEFI